jgi:hypothetical protein
MGAPGQTGSNYSVFGPKGIGQTTTPTTTPTTPAAPTPPSYTAGTSPALAPSTLPTTPQQADPNTLPGQVQGAYTGAVNNANTMATTGNQLLQGYTGYGQQAGDVYGDMAGMTPSDVTAGQLSTTDLSPYMNPYTQQVIDRSMQELEHQQGIQQQGIDAAAQNQNAFGGDRMYLQKGVLGGEFGRLKGNLAADLYQKNFLNAQQMGQYDIGNRLAADTTNQGMRGQLYSGGAAGLAGLFGAGGSLGANLMNSGTSQQGDLASAGFQMANQANAAQTQAAYAAQQQQQQQIDAANARLAQMLGIPQSYLQSMLGISSGLGNAGTTVGSTTSQHQPGALEYGAAGVGALATLGGMPIG